MDSFSEDVLGERRPLWWVSESQWEPWLAALSPDRAGIARAWAQGHGFSGQSGRMLTLPDATDNGHALDES